MSSKKPFLSPGLAIANQRSTLTSQQIPLISKRKEKLLAYTCFPFCNFGEIESNQLLQGLQIDLADKELTSQGNKPDHIQPGSCRKTCAIKPWEVFNL